MLRRNVAMKPETKTHLEKDGSDYKNLEKEKFPAAERSQETLHTVGV